MVAGVAHAPAENLAPVPEPGAHVLAGRGRLRAVFDEQLDAVAPSTILSPDLALYTL
jgi:hypothetical protein